ncbi:Uncharacterised protein [uncultured archaeon]|nr:Uncharacterised protein [uncultured archaeon]
MNQNSAISISKNYIELLRKSEEDRAFLLAHKEEIPGEKFETFLESANRDIDHARSRLQHVSAGIPAPRIPSAFPERPRIPLALPEVKTDVKPAENIFENDSSNNNLRLLGGVIGGLVAFPLVLNWASKDPKNNLQTMQDVIKIFKKISTDGLP